MKSFDVEVTRIGYAYKTMSVEAETLEKAESLALDEAGDLEWSERESDYILPNSPQPNDREKELARTLRLALLQLRDWSDNEFIIAEGETIRIQDELDKLQ